MATLHEIGKSHRGRAVWLLEISNPATGPAENKPGYYIDANIHAEEISGTSVVRLHGLDAAQPVRNRSAGHPACWMSRSSIWCPVSIPTAPRSSRRMPFYEWIGNGRYLPGEEQFGPGLHYADINDDGFILDMRIRDDAGEWRISDKDDRLMMPRGPDETGGDYYRIVPEGTTGRLGRRRFCRTPAPGRQPQPQLSVQLGARKPAVWLRRTSAERAGDCRAWCVGFSTIPISPACRTITPTAA